MSVTHAHIAGPVLEAIESPRDGNGVLRLLRMLWKTMFNEPYRPERHYMRGPGPAYARKHTLIR